MELTELLARFWGLVLVVAGSALLVNKQLLSEILSNKDRDGFVLLTGFIALLLGALHIAAYNYFEISVRGLITLFGWFALLKGAIRLSAPDFSKKAIAQVGANNTLYYSLLTILMTLGFYFLYIGFVQ